MYGLADHSRSEYFISNLFQILMSIANPWGPWDLEGSNGNNKITVGRMFDQYPGLQDFSTDGD